MNVVAFFAGALAMLAILVVLCSPPYVNREYRR